MAELDPLSIEACRERAREIFADAAPNVRPVDSANRALTQAQAIEIMAYRIRDERRANLRKPA